MSPAGSCYPGQVAVCLMVDVTRNRIEQLNVGLHQVRGRLGRVDAPSKQDGPYSERHFSLIVLHMLQHSIKLVPISHNQGAV